MQKNELVNFPYKWQLVFFTAAMCYIADKLCMESWNMAITPIAFVWWYGIHLCISVIITGLISVIYLLHLSLLGSIVSKHTILKRNIKLTYNNFRIVPRYIHPPVEARQQSKFDLCKWLIHFNMSLHFKYSSMVFTITFSQIKHQILLVMTYNHSGSKSITKYPYDHLTK